MIAPEQRLERLEEMAVAMIALLATVAPQHIANLEPPPQGGDQLALSFGLLLRPDVAALFSPEEFSIVYKRLTARVAAHAAALDT